MHTRALQCAVPYMPDALKAHETVSSILWPVPGADSAHMCWQSDFSCSCLRELSLLHSEI